MTKSASSIPQAILDEARDRYESVQARIADAARGAGRSPDEITLVGVAKRQPRERVLAAIQAGLRVLGQSYIQEAREVRPEIETALATSARASGGMPPALEWRMVGKLQRNKAGIAARLFDAIESVDRDALASTLSRRAVDEGCDLEVLIQVSLCGEEQKGGCLPDDMLSLAESILELPNLRLEGLMTVPAANADPEASRPAFAALRELRERLGALEPRLAGGTLSMGMSGDLEVAIEEGATLVRVGTALFGERSVG
jgi:pyridoxal phosphate enzyme (YggS family)